MRRGYAAANPVTQLDRHERPQGQPERMNILDTDEIRLVLAGCSQTYYALLATAVFTGLRMGELRNLKWEDVDWDAGVLGVKDSKTKAGVREVVLMPALQQILATHSLDHSGELVFATKTGKTIHPSSLRRDALTPALEKAGVTKRIRFHDLRHTYASILISQGHDEAFICDQMGHSNPAITRRVYGHLFDRDRRREEARKKLEDAFGEVLS